MQPVVVGADQLNETNRDVESVVATIFVGLLGAGLSDTTTDVFLGSDCFPLRSAITW